MCWTDGHLRDAILLDVSACQEEDSAYLRRSARSSWRSRYTCARARMPDVEGRRTELQLVRALFEGASRSVLFGLRCIPTPSINTRSLASRKKPRSIEPTCASAKGQGPSATS